MLVRKWVGSNTLVSKYTKFSGLFPIRRRAAHPEKIYFCHFPKTEEMADSNIYSIPYRFRRIENLHILLWLIKDACWAVNFRVLGMIMIIPTLAVAVIITWQTRGIISELLHNIVVALWITANCTWMVGEFWGLDENLWGPYGLRQATVIPFSIGLLILLYYYVFLARDENFKARMAEKTQAAIEEEIRRRKTL